MCEPISGVPEFTRPLVSLEGHMSFWEMRAVVNTALKKAGLNQSAHEFRQLVEKECDGDSGMLFTLALLFIRLPGQEEI